MANITEEYNNYESSIADKIGKLKNYLKSHQQDFDGKNWGYVGDLKAVVETLDAILESFETMI